MIGTAGPGMLAGLRVIEVADELAEYTGLLLAGLGADVVKIEPPDGAPTRRIGPFLDDEPHPERSLFFWNYNRAKRSVTLDIHEPAGREALLRLLDDADILLDSSCGDLNAALGLDRSALGQHCPKLVIARMTPFGDTGPWKDFKGSDLVHLALGGEMMNCGYDPDPAMKYDTPPIAPQMWNAYHIAGEQLAVGVIAALLHRHHTGEGQDVSVAVHEAVAKNTELDLMHWVMRRAPLYRLTCRHAAEVKTHVPVIAHTKDGRWFITHGTGPRELANLIPFLGEYGMAADLKPPDASVDLRGARNVPGSTGSDEGKSHMLEVIQRFIRAHTYEDVPWRKAQDAGLLWAPLRKPHENALDEHWLRRHTYTDIEHPELGRAFRYTTSKWLSTHTSWQSGKRAPLAGEHTAEVLEEAPRPSTPARPRPSTSPVLSARKKPFALQGIRILDFSWFLASAGGTRLLTGLGAESLKVEWKANPDTRMAAMAPVGGRAARERATAPLPGVTDPDMGGNFNHKNAGKRGISLNVRDPRGLAIAKSLVKISDIVAEGFSPGVLDRLGLGYDVLRDLKPDIIYVQQAGMGAHGAYRCEGEDRWIAIACFTDAEWDALVRVAGRPEWTRDARFASLQSRLAHQDELDATVGEWTRTQEPFDCMDRLQRAGVPAGVCQDAEDRCERDPQLAELQWLTELTGSKIGRWPVGELSMKMSATPPYAGGIIDRGAPCYGEDNEHVLTNLLGLSRDDVRTLAADGVI
jgi:crotonobetainyl-CoA:carnitine CoA-transferase CaiB-like acyl-CoA transferase